MPQIYKATPIDENGVVKCYGHTLQASLRMSNTTSNPGRLFYCCSKDMNDKERCDFFYWANDPIFKQEHPRTQATPTPSSSQLHTSATQISTSPMTPSLKRSFAASGTSQQAPVTPSQKRLKIMEDALSSDSARRSAPPSQRPSSTPESKRQRFIQIASALSSARRKPHLSQGREIFSKSSNHGLETQLFQNLVQKPATESAIFSPIEETNCQAQIKNEIDEDAKLWTPMTPPNSFQELEPHAEGVDSGKSTTPFSQKGKERAKEAGISWCPSDPENPFEGSSNSRTDNSIDFSADLISSLLNNLNAIPEYLRRLERQKAAAEKSNYAKADKICELEEEVARLKLNKQELEESIKALELRRQ